MLRQAVADLQAKEDEPRHSAARWITSGSEDDLVSFSGCCETVGLDPERVRQRLAAIGLLLRK
jgi:hypothetical protein